MSTAPASIASWSIRGAVLATAGIVIWYLWPRPDTVIEVSRGGIATVHRLIGAPQPLGDTVVVGGSGARRSVRVINRDTVRHILSLFSVDAGSQMDYTVPPGTFGGYCSAHVDGRTLTIVVR